MINIGSTVSVSKTGTSGIVLSIENDFAQIRSGHDVHWYKITDLVSIEDNFIDKFMNKNFDTLHDFVLCVDANRLDIAHKWNPIVYASATRIDIYPHQLESVMWALHNPRVMVADEVGLGKTIIALLTVYELYTARKVIDRVLIIVPSPLVSKWINELKARFNINATNLDNAYLKYNADAFKAKRYVYVSSMDFLKRADVISLLPSDNIDCVIIDEAHKAKKGTDRHNLARKMSQATQRLLLLTATPHDGHDEHFLSLMQLLSPDIETPAMAPLYISRNLKENVIDIRGNVVFPPRTSKTIEIDLPPREREIYTELEKYIKKCNASARTQKEINAIRFISIIFRKRASSSLYSLLSSLKRRRDKLGTISVDEAMGYVENIKSYDDDLDDIEHDHLGTKNNNLRVELYTAQSNLDEEKQDLDVIINKIQHLDNQDSKFDRLKTMIDMLRKSDKQAQLIIFTEYRSTLDYLYDRLSSYSTGKIDGGMKMFDREVMRENFKKKKFNILICTDAAGEGIDMQFCNMEVNYDIPWNPNRLEQRMGRIHRIGQTRHVEYHNFVLRGNNIGADGYIHKLLLEKLDTIKKTLGDGVYDLLGPTYTQEQFANLCEQLVQLPYQDWEKPVRPFTDEVAKKIKATSTQMNELLGANILNKMSPEKIQSLQKTSVDAMDIKRFFGTFILTSGGSITEFAKNAYKIIPLNIASKFDMKIIIGTYDKSLAYSSSLQYLALGDRDVDIVIDHAKSNRPLSILRHPTRDGLLFAYRVTIFDGSGTIQSEQLCLLHCDTSNKITLVDEKSVWDYAAYSSGNLPNDILPNMATANSFIEKFSLKTQAKINQEIESDISKYQKFATREANAQVSHFEILITQTQNASYQDPSYVELIRNFEKQKERVYEKWNVRKKEINSLANTRYTWDLLAMAIIIPDAGMMENLRVEQAGMSAALKHENARAATDSERNLIADVSFKSCGYDIESFNSRHIEVKSFLTTGDPSMTSNEWDTARRYGNNYWLYVVEHSTTLPKIHTIQNPYSLYKNTIVRHRASTERWVITNWKSKVQSVN